ncbi:MAG: glycosyltransferase family 39 protein [Candidatus Aenigmatarchaeota archaeon]|nr:MAG: glycosyltransferase family 39 protein [Candidatus Aenigmarchaeota archaeon]
MKINIDMMGDRRVAFALLMVSYVFLLSIPLVDVPLNEDSMASLPIKIFLSENRLEFVPFMSFTYFAQFAYGLAFAGIFGFSFANLQLATIVLSGLTVTAFYFLLRRYVGKTESALGALLLLTNPIFINYSHSFASDLHALFYIVLATYFGARAVETNSNRHLFMCVLASTAGFYVRQYSIAILGGVFLYYILVQRKNLTAKKFAIMTVIPSIAVIAWLYWAFFVSPRIVLDIYHTPGLGLTQLANVSRSLFFMSLFFLPFGPAVLANIKTVFARVDRRAFWVGGAAVGISIAWLAQRAITGKYLLYGVSVINQKGIGNIGILGRDARAPIFPEMLWIPIVAMSLVCLFYLAVTVYNNRKDAKTLPLIFIALAYLVATDISRLTIDRYFIAMMIPLTPLLMRELSKMRNYRLLLGGALVLMAVWGWYGTYEHVTINKVGWDATQELVRNGVDVQAIDGSVDFNVFYSTCTTQKVFCELNYACVPEKTECDYTLTFIPDDDVVTSRDYFSPFGNKRGTLYVVRANE